MIFSKTFKNRRFLAVVRLKFCTCKKPVRGVIITIKDCSTTIRGGSRTIKFPSNAIMVDSNAITDDSNTIINDSNA